jgi:hypothetical protein
LKTVEEYARELSTPLWLFEAARRKFRWVKGQQFTASDYEAALKVTEQHSAKR